MASIRVGTVAAITSGGPTQDLAPSGMTATPKFSLIELTSTTTAGTVADHARYGVGFTDGTTQRAMGNLAEDGISAGSANCQVRFDNDAVVDFTITANNNLDAKAAHSSFAAGKHVISWSDFPAVANILKFVEIGGTDVSVSVQDVACPATDGGTATVSGLSFAPNLAIIVGRASAAFANDTTQNNSQFTIGYAIKTLAGDIEQFCFTDFNANLTTPSDGRSILRSNRCAARLAVTSNGSAVELTSWTSDGAVFTTRQDGGTLNTVDFAVALLKVPRSLKTLVSLLDTNATGNKDITGVGFAPIGYFCIATPLEGVDAGTSGANHGRWSHGCVDDNATATACVGNQVEDGTTVATDTRSITSATQFARVLDDAGADDWSASHNSFLSDGVRITIDDASTNDKYAAFLFWSVDDQDLVAAETEEITDAAVLAGAAVVLGNDTEEITDAAVLSGAATTVADDTEDITDEAVLSGAAAVVCDETEDITDECVLIAAADTFLVCDEACEISDECVLVVHKIICDETEEISDECQLVGAATIVASETEEITDQALLVTGRLLVVDETEEITDTVVFVERRLRSGGWRGTSLQGGAEAGTVLSAGSARGTARG